MPVLFPKCENCKRRTARTRCETCGGTGRMSNINGHLVKCDYCDGAGGWYYCPHCIVREKADIITTQRRL